MEVVDTCLIEVVGGFNPDEKMLVNLPTICYYRGDMFETTNQLNYSGYAQKQLLVNHSYANFWKVDTRL